MIVNDFAQLQTSDMFRPNCQEHKDAIKKLDDPYCPKDMLIEDGDEFFPSERLLVG